MTRETTPTFLLVPGAGGRADYWHLVEPELAARGYDAVAVELPAADDAAGLVQYADCVLRRRRRLSAVRSVCESFVCVFTTR